jgi:hypothetical protein
MKIKSGRLGCLYPVGSSGSSCTAPCLQHTDNPPGSRSGKLDKKNPSGRRSERFAVEAPIQFAAAQNPRLFASKISNCSQSGICFESGVHLHPGTVFFVAAAGDAKYYRAQVKWSEKLGGKGTERYAIGAEYLDPP